MNVYFSSRAASNVMCAGLACSAFLLTRRYMSKTKILCATGETLDEFGARVENEFRTKLDTDGMTSNPKQSRAVKSGHWVPAQTTKLPKPYMVIASRDFCRELKLNFDETKTQRFADCFAGDEKAFPSQFNPWCVPYGVSVHGQWLTNSPFGVWGYGDGRAITLCDVEGRSGRWELQLKGGGPTAFARNFDGRAVLRSSIREFLASEAMHHLGVPTTRALCTVTTDDETIMRAWYPGSDQVDPAQGVRLHSPPRMGKLEKCAITCRAAPSFLRVGQFELFFRTRPREELTKLFNYAIEREFPQISTKAPLKRQAIQMFEELAHRQAFLVSEWQRVGYIQGNMNSDNCLLNGRTVDYGPFGYLEEFDPRAQPFTSDPAGNFCYQQQPVAARINLVSFGGALMSMAPEDEQDEWIEELNSVLKGFMEKYANMNDENNRKKLGLTEWNDEVRALWIELNKCLVSTPTDFIVFFRQLADVDIEQSPEAAMTVLEPAFYGDVNARDMYHQWITKWQVICKKQGMDKEERVKMMKRTSPKYIPRNWMLLRAYEAAERKDFSVCEELISLYERPYDEGTSEQISKWYMRTPEWARNKGGVAFMS